MSYAKPKPVNPATKFIDLKGDTGIFTYWKKPESEGQSGESIEVPFPIKFVVVDELSVITGYNKDSKSGVYSNEVRNIKNDILSVRCFNSKHGLLGKYQEIKGDIKSLGGKYAKSVYAMMISGGSVELVNFKVSGSFLNAWIESKVNTDREGIIIEECIGKKNGKVDYFEPVIKSFIPANEEKTKQLAGQFYQQLSTFFKDRNAYYEEQFSTQEIAKEEPEETPATVGDDDLPF